MSYTTKEAIIKEMARHLRKGFRFHANKGRDDEVMLARGMPARGGVFFVDAKSGHKRYRSAISAARAFAHLVGREKAERALIEGSDG